MDCIEEGVVVLIQRDRTYRPFTLQKGRKLNFEKVSFYPDGALGLKFGSCFKVEDQQLKQIGESEEVCELAPPDDGEFGSDNRTIHDDGMAQELTEVDVRAMKGRGTSGKGIVTSMIEHSSSFKEKTKFSQEKYIKKKKQKYIPIFRIIRTTTLLLCELYFTQTPSKTYYLRIDALSQILAMSNTRACSNMIVMETCQGFMTGAMLERMGGFGKLVQVFYGDFPVRTILSNFGHLSSTDKSILMTYPFNRMSSLLTQQETEKVVALSKQLVSSSEQPQAVGEKSSSQPQMEMAGSQQPQMEKKAGSRGRKRKAKEMEESSSTPTFDGFKLLDVLRDMKRERENGDHLLSENAFGDPLKKKMKLPGECVGVSSSGVGSEGEGASAATLGQEEGRVGDGGGQVQSEKKGVQGIDSGIESEVQEKRDSGMESEVQEKRDSGMESQVQEKRDSGMESEVQEKRDSGMESEVQEKRDSGMESEVQEKRDSGMESEVHEKRDNGMETGGKPDGQGQEKEDGATESQIVVQPVVLEKEESVLQSQEQEEEGVRSGGQLEGADGGVEEQEMESREAVQSEGQEMEGEKDGPIEALQSKGQEMEGVRDIEVKIEQGERVGSALQSEGQEMEGGVTDVKPSQAELEAIERKKEAIAKKRNRKKERAEAYVVSKTLLSQRSMDGLVIVCRHHPEPVLMTLIHFLAPSRPFVVYCHLLEPLVQCYKSLKDTCAVFNLQISETWMRHYQVLQERTHPEMMMGGQSGFILTGMTVAPHS